MILAVIPARGGSKRIRGKNVRFFCGRPIMAYSIDAVLESGIFDRVIVSTDDEVIAQTAEKLGAEVPFRRPPELSGDVTPTVPVIRHAVEWVEKNWAAPVQVCCVYPTAPFLRAEDLCEGQRCLSEHPGTDFVVSATDFGFPVQRALQAQADGTMELLYPEHDVTRSQDLPETFHDAGQFYWGTPGAWSAHDGFFKAVTRIVRLPRYRVQDIDTEEDWKRAEWIFRAMQAEDEQSL